MDPEAELWLHRLKQLEKNIQTSGMIWSFRNSAIDA